MREHPILFGSEMVRAILDGRKTQTRRVITNTEPYEPIDDGIDVLWATDQLYCPYGVSGDRLWVRESFYVQPELWSKSHGPQPVHYAANTVREQVEDYILKPSIHMPRWASRITLEIVKVRVERLQDITDRDMQEEGVEGPSADGYHPYLDRIDYWKKLWDSINAKRGYGWDANPWVWVIEFKRIDNL